MTLQFCSKTNLHCSKTHILVLQSCSKTALFLLPELLQKAEAHFHPRVCLVEEVHLVAEEHPLAPQEETGNDEGKTDRVNSVVACVPAQVPESSSDLLKAHTAVSAATDTTHCTVANSESHCPEETEAACGNSSNLPLPLTTFSIDDVSNIKLVKPMRKCGCPKGHTLTVIGLPKK